LPSSLSPPSPHWPGLWFPGSMDFPSMTFPDPVSTSAWHVKSLTPFPFRFAYKEMNHSLTSPECFLLLLKCIPGSLVPGQVSTAHLQPPVTSAKPVCSLPITVATVPSCLAYCLTLSLSVLAFGIAPRWALCPDPLLAA
jgi:hypothetical protein